MAMRWIIGLAVLWLLMTAAAAWVFSTFNDENRTACANVTASATSAGGVPCAAHSLTLPLILILVGAGGFIVTGLVAKIWAARRFGMGLIALRRLQRPRGFVRRHFPALAVTTVVVAVAATVLAGNIDGIRNTLEGLSPQYVQIYPVQTSASSFLPAHPPGFVDDGATTTFWGTSAAAGARAGIQQTVTLTYNSSNLIQAFSVISGDQFPPRSFAKTAHPKYVELLFSSGPPAFYTLANVPTFQQFRFAPRDSTFLELKILSVYPGPAPCAITELAAYTQTG